jgi:hypothetical protein
MATTFNFPPPVLPHGGQKGQGKNGVTPKGRGKNGNYIGPNVDLIEYILRRICE